MRRKLTFLMLASLVALVALSGCSKPVTDASNDPPAGAKAADMNSTAPAGGGGGSTQAQPQGATPSTE